MMRAFLLFGILSCSMAALGGEWKTPLVRGEGSLAFSLDKDSRLTVSVSEKGGVKTTKTTDETVADIFAIYSIPSKDCYVVATLEHIGTPCEYNQYLMFFRYDNKTKKIIFSGKIRTFNGCDVSGLNKNQLNDIMALQIFLGAESWNRGRGIVLYRGAERIEMQWDAIRSIIYSKIENNIPVIALDNQKWQFSNGEWIEK